MLKISFAKSKVKILEEAVEELRKEISTLKEQQLLDVERLENNEVKILQEVKKIGEVAARKFWEDQGVSQEVMDKVLVKQLSETEK